jgi:D-aminoacyl-tRNA deacylase
MNTESQHKKSRILFLVSTTDAASLNLYKSFCEVSSPFSQMTQILINSQMENSVNSANEVALFAITSTQIMHTLHLCKTNMRHVAQIPNLVKEYDLLIFLSKHASVSGKPSFCVHTQGNFGEAKLGGSIATLGVCPVVFKNTYYQHIYGANLRLNLGFDVVHEATHHGPDCNVPSVFVEIGSTQLEWENIALAHVVRDALYSTLCEYSGETTFQNSQSNKSTHTEILPAIFGIGGSHTCTNFNRLSFEKKALLGHVCANYNIFDLTPELITQTVDKATLPCEIIVDWKSLDSAQRTHVSSVLEGRTWRKLKDLKAQVDIPDLS